MILHSDVYIINIKTFHDKPLKNDNLSNKTTINFWTTFYFFGVLSWNIKKSIYFDIVILLRQVWLIKHKKHTKTLEIENKI